MALQLTKTQTQTKTKTKTKFLKDPTCAIFLKSRGFKDIKYGTQRPHPDRIQTASRPHHQCIISASSSQSPEFYVCHFSALKNDLQRKSSSHEQLIHAAAALQSRFNIM